MNKNILTVVGITILFLSIPVASSIALVDKFSEKDDESGVKCNLIIKNDDFPDIAIIGEQNYVTTLLGDGIGGFGNRKEYEIGRFTTDIVTEDFNNDGFLDLFILNSDDHDASMFFGDGDGGFKKRPDCRMGKYPCQMTSADFNQDGFLDIAVTHYDFPYPSTLLGMAISVLFGLGNGRFRIRRIYFAGWEPWGIVSGKFNRDRFPDIAVGEMVEGTVNVLFNRIFGRFGFPISFLSSCEMPIEFTSADFNMDGYLDLAVSDFMSGLAVHFNDGWGRFYTYKFFEAGEGSHGIVSGDFNRDSFPDIAVTNVDDDDFSILFNDGNGSLINRKDYPVGKLPYHIVTADFNMDGFLDLVVGNYKDKDITVYLGVGNGSFVKHQEIPVGCLPGTIVVGNFNSRRKPDMPEITGKRVGGAEDKYVYTFMSSDPYKLDVSYYIKWGDGAITDWTAFQASGTAYNESHNWSKSWIYSIKAKVKNTDDDESNWATFRVVMLRNKVSIGSLFQLFFDRFPLLEVFLRAMNLLR